ncbi:prenyltransferase/squalene oxidase repeat-containing protein [Streptomyces triticiradicis]|uniref:Terpene cyclase/mutase family protein n=1 Tax=Streptomyces triticiradicis TaxID=2651189 RepID=A0A7J5DMK0_9ACTN|nr:prenyltransferase/squalene oxidase repeat-containing protein [Streptomyces triticiradicis]KAB1989944.1 terpene cyclase/mutase family protein [Streptomyces triticiradicis]
MSVRRTAAVLAATAVIGAVAAPAASAAGSSPSPSPSVALPSGLFGSADPTYDGVWRQSLALLAQHTVGQSPASSAIGWLTGQQCANGAFAAYRADASAACDAKTQVDTNSTAAAVQALGALGGHDDATGKAVAWLKSAQNKDGGWGYMPGGPSDTNSTSVVIGALKALGTKPASVTKDGKSPYDALLKLSTACDSEGAGAFAYQPDKKGKLAANADATAAGVTAGMGQGFVAEPGKTFDLTGCHVGYEPDLADAAGNGANYLAKTMAKTSYLKSALPGAEDQPDYGNTADAVVALAAVGATKDAQKPLAWLEKNSADWAAKSGPAAYAQLIFAAHATGTDPRAFGGEDLVARLAATGPGPVAGGATASPSEKKNDEKKDDGNGLGVWWIIGVGLVAGIGIGFLISGRNKKQQL